jgi:hypothetical protein
MEIEIETYAFGVVECVLEFESVDVTRFLLKDKALRVTQSRRLGVEPITFSGGFLGDIESKAGTLNLQ